MPSYRVVSLDKHGKPHHQDFKNVTALLAAYEQVGVEEDSYTMRLHGEPTLRGLVGPMSDGKSVVRYETPQAFVILTEEWTRTRKTTGRGSRSKDADEG